MGKSQRELRNRIKSVESTMHITRAMELVSSSKFKRAFDSFELGRSYYDLLNETFEDISVYAKDSPFFREYASTKKTYIVIAGDRGLVGGLNNNLYKLVEENGNGSEKTEIIPFGKKATEHYRHDERFCLKDGFEICEKISTANVSELSSELTRRFISGETHEVFVVYTKYVNMMSQEAVCLKLFPIVPSGSEKKASQMLFEPSAEGVLAKAVPEYISGIIYGALMESIVSENAARRMAMDSATKNAGDIIDSLTLEYNRARQSAITQEITEIVAGSEK